MDVQLPSTPLILTGVLGGPGAVFALTPLRTALALAGADSSLNVVESYRRVFAEGWRPAWSGGQKWAFSSLPNFVILGPIFHVYRDLVGGSTLAAAGLVAATETLMLYGNETLSTQAAYNRAVAPHNLEQIKQVHRWYVPWGPGIGFHFARNFAVAAGLRVASESCQEHTSSALPPLLAGVGGFTGVLLVNTAANSCTSILNPLYQFSITQRLVNPAMTKQPFHKAAWKFLRGHFTTKEGNLTKTAQRDIFIRSVYYGCLYTAFFFVERGAVLGWSHCPEVRAPLVAAGRDAAQGAANVINNAIARLRGKSNDKFDGDEKGVSQEAK